MNADVFIDTNVLLLRFSLDRFPASRYAPPSTSLPLPFAGRCLMSRLLLCALATLSLALPFFGAEPAARDQRGDPLPADAYARLGTRSLRHTNFMSAVAVAPTEKLVAAGDGDGHIVLWDLASGKAVRRIDADKPQVPGRGNQGMPVAELVFSPDGKTLAAIRNLRIQFWEVATGKERKLLKEEDPPTMWSGIAFAPNGKTFAAVGPENRVHLWDLSTGKALEPFECFQGPVSAVAFSADGKLLAAGDGTSIRIWDMATRKQLGKLRRHSITVNALAFSPDAKLLASGGEDQTVRLWDVAEGKELRRLAHPFTRPATQHFLADYNLTHATVAFTPDGTELVSSIRADRGIRRWEVATGKELMKYEGHQDGSTCVALSHDGKTLVAGGEDSCLRGWDVAGGKELFTDDGHRGRVFGVAFAADGKTLLSAGRDNLVRRWDLANYRELGGRFGGDADRIGIIAFAADGKTVATARHDDETIQIWDAVTGKLHRELEHKQAGIYGLAFGPGGRTLFSVNNAGLVVQWDVAAAKLVREFNKDDAGAAEGTSVSVSGDGRRVASLQLGAVRVWEVATGKEVRTISRDEQQGPLYFRVLLSPDGSIVAALGLDNTLSLFDVDSGKLLHKISGLGVMRDEGMMIPESIAFSPDGRAIAAVGTDGHVHLYEVASGLELRKFQTGQGWVGSLAFAPDGRAIATGGIDTTVMLWDLTGLRQTPAPAELSADELAKLWADLQGEDGGRVSRAFWVLAAAKKHSLPFLKSQLKPAVSMEAKRFTQLVADLDSDKFAVRQKATELLENNLDLIEGDLRKLLASKPPLEVRQRLEKILEKINAGPPPPERLRVLRALGVLEYIGDAEARALLEALTKGASEAWLTKESRNILARLPK